MEAIIQQIAMRFIEEVFENIREKGISEIGETIKGLSDLTANTALSIVRAVIEETDAAIISATKMRRKDTIRIKEKNVPRVITTHLGDLHYKRTYYEIGENERCYLLDSLIGVERYERISKVLCAAMVQEASEKSMGQAAKGAHTEVSRQTVNNKILSLKEVVTQAVRESKTPKELHVFADEDHVHLKNGRSAIVPLVTVTEGIDESEKRHKTISPVHFSGYRIQNDSFFEGISSFLNEKYDMDRVETVYVHSDGAQWIRAAGDWQPNVMYDMDGFHIQKRLKQIGRIEGAAPYMGALNDAICNGDIERFRLLCSRMNNRMDERGRKIFMEHEKFIYNHWDAIVLSMSGTVCGSCTEPLVSHVLSKRLSRNPLAWSEEGLSQMSMLRVYTKNGGVVSSIDIRVSRRKKPNRDKSSIRNGFFRYREYADKQIDGFLSAKRDWSIFDNELFHYGKLDGTSVMLKAFSQLHSKLASA